MAAGRHLGFDPNGNGAVRSAVPENPTLQPNMKGIGRRVAEILPFEVFHTLTGHRISETGHASDFIFRPMLLCIALDGQ